MNNSDSDALIESVATIAAAQIPRYTTEKYAGSVPRELFTSLAEHGVAGVGLAEEYGGLGLGPDIFARVIEELAAQDLGVAIFISVHSMVAGLLQRFAADALKDDLLPDLALGKKLAAFALTEPGAGSDAAAIATRASKKGDAYILNGEKCYITSAGFADVYLVFAKTNPAAGHRGISAFLVPAGSAGLEIGTPEKKMGAELSPIATLSLTDVSVPARHLVGTENEGFAVALGGLAGGRVTIAACAVGIARTALEKAIAHTRERKQFGSAISEFQGVQFMLADMKIQLEAARLLTKDAAETLTNMPEARINRSKASIAKCFATDAAMQITTDAVQLLGGAGYLADYGVEKLMRDAKMLQIVEGTNQIQRNVIARELLR